MIKLTENAIIELKRIINGQNMEIDKIYLHVDVTGSGCSGCNYSLSVEDEYRQEEEVLESSEFIKITFNKKDKSYLENIVIDFYNELDKYGFKFDSSQPIGNCGCLSKCKSCC